MMLFVHYPQYDIPSPPHSPCIVHQDHTLSSSPTTYAGTFAHRFSPPQGANASQLEKEIGADQFPPNEHYIGLVNVSIKITVYLHFCFPTGDIVMVSKILYYIVCVKRNDIERLQEKVLQL